MNIRKFKNDLVENELNIRLLGNVDEANKREQPYKYLNAEQEYQSEKSDEQKSLHTAKVIA